MANAAHATAAATIWARRLSGPTPMSPKAMLASATDHEKVLGLNRELREVVDEREALELEWLEAAEVIG